MYIKEKIKNHFSNLLENPKFALAYFYNRDIVEEFNNSKLVELQNNLRKTERRYNNYFNLYSLVKFLGIESLVEKVTKNLAMSQKMYSKNSNDIDIFKSNLAYLIISGILKLENAEVMGYSKEFIEEFLVPYQNQANNPYNEYFYNEANGRTSIIDEKGFSKVLGYTPYSVLEKIKQKESESYFPAGISSFKRKIRR